jgi:hypothetical protein
VHESWYCDTVVNKSLKARIEELADQYTDEHEMEWVEGKYTVSQRRVLLNGTSPKKTIGGLGDLLVLTKDDLNVKHFYAT